MVATMEAFVARHGRIDVLINNAGFGHFAPLIQPTDTDKNPALQVANPKIAGVRGAVV